MQILLSQKLKFPISPRKLLQIHVVAFSLNDVVIFLEVYQYPDNITAWNHARNQWCRIFVTYFITCKYTSCGRRSSCRHYTCTPVFQKSLFPTSSSWELLPNTENNTENNSSICHQFYINNNNFKKNQPFVFIETKNLAHTIKELRPVYNSTFLIP